MLTVTVTIEVGQCQLSGADLAFLKWGGGGEGGSSKIKKKAP